MELMVRKPDAFFYYDLACVFFIKPKCFKPDRTWDELCYDPTVKDIWF
jgi:hypothetical protein